MAEPQLKDTFSNIRIPLYEGTKNTSINAIAVGDIGQRAYLNCFPVTDMQGDIWVQKRQGMSALNTTFSAIMGSVPSNCFYNIAFTQLNNIHVCAVFDYTNNKFYIIEYRPTTQTYTEIGQLTGASSSDEIFLSELNIGGVPYLGVVYHTADSSNSNAYYAASNGVNFTSASLVQITDADFPSELATPEHLVGPMVQLNGTTYVMTKKGNIYSSNINSISSWSGAKISATQYPDGGIGLCRYKHMIAAFGRDSVEFFADTGSGSNLNSPLQRVDQNFIKFGCVHPRSFINIDDKLYWIGKSSSGTNGLWVLDGNAPKKLSRQAEDVAIAATSDMFYSAGPHNLRVWPITLNSKKHLIIGSGELAFAAGAYETFTGDVNSLVGEMCSYCHLCMTLDEEEFWLYVSPLSDVDRQFFPLMANTFQSYSTSSNINDQYCPGAYTGATIDESLGHTIYKFEGTIPPTTALGKDYSTSVLSHLIVCGVQVSAKDFGNKKQKFISKLALNQQGLDSNSTSADLWLLWSKNDRATDGASDLTAIKTGRAKLSIPVNTNRLYTRRLGLARSWSFAFVIKTADNFAAHSFELDVSQGTR